MRSNRIKKILFLFLVFLGVVLIALRFGSVRIPLGELFSKSNSQILYLRFLRVMIAVFVGAGLSVCGVCLQAILRNPLADPYLLGTSGGAGLGAVLAITLGISSAYYPFAAFCGALLSIVLVYNLAKEGNKIPTRSLILAGVVVAMVFSGLMIFLISMSSNQALHGIMWWLLGSLQIYDIRLLFIVGTITILGIGTISIFSQDLNAISVGDEEAVHLGIDIEKMKKILFLITALITGALVSISGMIGFVGLIIPHMMRMIVGPNHKTLIPASCIAGATFLVLCDCISRTVFPPIEISIGVITSLIGAPIFIILLKKRQKVK